MDWPVWLIGLLVVYTGTFLGTVLFSRSVTEFVADDTPLLTSPYHTTERTDAQNGACPRCGTDIHGEHVYCQSCLAGVESETAALTDDANAT